jgi:hypothetical protein
MIAPYRIICYDFVDVIKMYVVYEISVSLSVMLKIQVFWDVTLILYRIKQGEAVKEFSWTALP